MCCLVTRKSLIINEILDILRWIIVTCCNLTLKLPNYEKEFMDIHDKLKISFCHGDLHPLNVIWHHDQIRAVIDWEFTGMKPDIYDAANLVGCAGIEDPNGLGMPMVMTFLNHILRKNLFSKTEWRFFPEYVLALRFAWLSEWLRKKDEEMIEMEEAYMGILLDNMDILRKEWEAVR